MKVLLCFLIAVLAAKAGVVQGVVLEHASGRPMARSQLRLTPVPRSGNTAKPFAMRTGLDGQYTFLSVPEGWYILTASRTHYFPASYGQRLPRGTGTPLEVKEDSHVFVELHLRRMGAIGGHILDENGVGLSDIPVVAYWARLPLRIAASAISDDRGIYRIHGLQPGKYWVRTVAHTLDDGTGMLPTFSPEARETHEARAYPVAVDSETTDADIRPSPGQLFHLGGMIQCEPMGFPVLVRVVSETGARTASTRCGFPYSVQGLAPANYEVYADTEDHLSAGFIELFVDRDSEAGSVRAGPLPQVYVQWQGSGVLIGRHPDLSDSGSEVEIKSPQNLAPGHWEMGAKVGPGEFVESITNFGGGPRRGSRLERTSDWFDVFIGANGQLLQVKIADTAGHINGTVLTDKTPVIGIPVYLWPVAEHARRSLRGPMRVLSDVNGKYRFDGLPPGDYRLIASYDLTDIDEESIELTQAPVLHVDPSQTASADLAPWLAPS